jgi:hypothetical protein
MKNLLRLGVAILVITALAYWSILPLCGLIFSCGCSFESGITFCNIFEAGQPNCPWCSQSAFAFWMLFGAIMVVSAGTIWFALKWVKPAIGMGLLGGLLGYLFWGSLAGLAYALVRHYPTFYGINLY